MKFKSQKDILFSVLIYGVIIFIITVTVIDLFVNEIRSINAVFYIVNGAVVALLLWIYHGTSYELTAPYLKYASGPVRGKIKIDTITEIHINKTMWVGLKPATSRKGIIVNYEGGNSIYISPKTNEIFAQELLKLNDSIVITEG